MNGPVDERVSRLPGCFNKGFATDIFKEIKKVLAFYSGLYYNSICCRYWAIAKW